MIIEQDGCKYHNPFLVIAVVEPNLQLIVSRVHATLHPALSVRWSVGPSVGLSVTLYFFGVFELFGLTAPAQLLR